MGFSEDSPFCEFFCIPKCFKRDWNWKLASSIDRTNLWTFLKYVNKRLECFSWCYLKQTSPHKPSGTFFHPDWMTQIGIDIEKKSMRIFLWSYKLLLVDMTCQDGDCLELHVFLVSELYGNRHIFLLVVCTLKMNIDFLAPTSQLSPPSLKIFTFSRGPL